MQKLQGLNAHNSKHELSIEKFLTKSEEKFFDKVKHDKISSAASVRSSRRDSVWGTPAQSSFDHSRPSSPSTRSFADGMDDYSAALVADDAVVMSGLQAAMTREIGGWPLYTIVIGIGQMLSVTSFQISLLSGTSTQSNLDLYVVGGVFLAATAVWYPLFRLKPSVYVLSLPWIFFGIAFFLVGLPSVTSSLHWLHYDLASAATWSYAVASAAGFLFFGLNFGEEAVRPSLLILRIPSFTRLIAGRVDGSLDDACMYRARFPTSLGSRLVVLGPPALWRIVRLRDAVVDRAHCLAFSCHELPLRLPDALWFAWYVFCHSQV